MIPNYDTKVMNKRSNALTLLLFFIKSRKCDMNLQSQSKEMRNTNGTRKFVRGSCFLP